MSTKRALVGALTAVLVLLTGCGSSGHNDPPRSWIASEYDRSGRAFVTRTSAPAAVADAIEEERSSRGRTSRNGKVYLRYRDDIVAVSRHGANGSRIEIEDYRRGHQRWHSDVGGIWPAPGSSGGGHRGGGPGSGGK